MLDRSVTREVFEGLSSAGEALFYVLAALATLVFLVGLGLRIRKYLRGRREDRYGSLAGFLGRAVDGVWAAASTAASSSATRTRASSTR